MHALTRLEQAVLRSIFSETPALAPLLGQQLGAASVAERKNTGVGFFTTIMLPSDVAPVNSSRVLGHETHARLPGIEHGMGFVLFMEGGRLHLLEGYAFGSDSTASLDLNGSDFEVFRTQTLP